MPGWRLSRGASGSWCTTPRALLSEAMVRAGLGAVRRYGAAVAATAVRDTLSVSPPAARWCRRRSTAPGCGRRTPASLPRLPSARRLPQGGRRSRGATRTTPPSWCMGHPVARLPRGTGERQADPSKRTSPWWRPCSAPASPPARPHPPRPAGMTTGGEASVASSGPGPRAGTGYDLHRLVKGRPLILGGVTVPYHLGLAGRSDGDALVHAVPPTPSWAPAPWGTSGSTSLPATRPTGTPTASTCCARRGPWPPRAGWRVLNLDATVVCERPRLAPFLPSDAERRWPGPWRCPRPPSASRPRRTKGWTRSVEARRLPRRRYS